MRDSDPTPLPGWARLIDGLCLLLALLALIIFASGGFRERLFGFRVALTSPFRMLLWAAALGIVRHVLVRRRPIYSDLPTRLRRAWRTREVRTAFGALVGTRLPILFVGYIAIFMIGFPTGQAPWRVAENEFGNLPARWDVGWYLGIAVDGYSFSEAAKAGGQSAEHRVLSGDADADARDRPTAWGIVDRLRLGRHAGGAGSRSSAGSSICSGSRATCWVTSNGPGLRCGSSPRIRSPSGLARRIPSRCSCSAQSARSFTSVAGSSGRAPRGACSSG